MDGQVIGEAIVPGMAEGPLLGSSEPLSFWGGYDQKTGEIIDRRHPLSGQSAAGTILAIPFTRGSSTTTAILLESVRAEVGPAGIVTTGTDTFIALASIVAGELYGRAIPVISVDADVFAAVLKASRVRMHEDGSLDLI